MHFSARPRPPVIFAVCIADAFAGRFDLQDVSRFDVSFPGRRRPGNLPFVSNTPRSSDDFPMFSPPFFGEPAFTLWLVINGARPPALDATASCRRLVRRGAKTAARKPAGRPAVANFPTLSLTLRPFLPCLLNLEGRCAGCSFLRPPAKERSASLFLSTACALFLQKHRDATQRVFPSPPPGFWRAYAPRRDIMSVLTTRRR